MSKPNTNSSKDDVFQIIIDDLDDHTTHVDNGLRLSNGTSPSFPSAKKSELFISTNHKSIKESNHQSLGSISSSSELFMHNQSYVTPGDELLANTSKNVDPDDSGKEILYIFFEVERTRTKMQPAHDARLKPNNCITLSDI